MKGKMQEGNKFCVADKMKLDEYERIVEETAGFLCRRKVHGKAAVLYIEKIYTELVQNMDITRQHFTETVMNFVKGKKR